MHLPVKYRDIPPKEKRLVREEYARLQGGNCYYCKNPLDADPAHKVKQKRVNKRLFPKGFFENPQHLHHSHKSGLTLGVVHAHCNAVLWQYHGE